MAWKRRPYTGGTLERARNIADLRELARRRVPGLAFEYVEGGAEDESTLRANRAGFEALVFTTDANVFGSREWDQRNFAAPGRPTVRAALDVLRHPRWLYEVLVRHGIPRFRNVESFLPPGKASALGGSTVLPGLF